MYGYNIHNNIHNIQNSVQQNDENQTVSSFRVL